MLEQDTWVSFVEQSRSLRMEVSSLEFDCLTYVWLVLEEHHDAVYIVGALEEALIIRGMRYHPIDIENTVIRTHKRICEW